MARPACCADQQLRPLYSFKVPFSGEHLRVLFCLTCRAQYQVEVFKPNPAFRYEPTKEWYVL